MQHIGTHVLFLAEKPYICAAFKGKRGNPLGPLFDYMEIDKQILGYLEACLARPEYSDCFLIDLNVSKQGRIVVFLDADDGLTLQRCQEISRALEHSIDAAGLFNGKYSLEVSSPGIERPLIMRRQYPKHKGRKLSVTLGDGSRVEGILTDVQDEALVLKIANGKAADDRAIAFETIKESFVQISFKKW